MYRAKSNVWDIEVTDSFGKVCEYINKKKEKMDIIKNSYIQIKEVFKEYIIATNNYKDQLISIALKLFPNSDTVEGQLIQAFQSILLFDSEALNDLTNQIQEIIKNFKVTNNSGLDDFSKIYQTNYANAIQIYCDYISNYELYEKYLIHKELGILNTKIKDDSENDKIKQIINEKNDKNIENKKNGTAISE